MYRNEDIEQFISQHRHALDLQAPDAYGWKGLEKALQRLNGADDLEKMLMTERILFDAAEAPPQVWEGLARRLDQPCAQPDTNRQQDALENFICQNRGDFDNEIPNPALWSRLESHAALQPVVISPRRNGFTWQKGFLRAAAAVSLIVVGALIGFRIGALQQSTTEGMSLAEVSDEYGEVEAHFQRDIAVKREKLAAFATQSTQARMTGDDVLGDLEKMDIVMQELRQELANVPPGNREQVVRAMIDNYKAKSAILERVLNQLQTQSVKNDSSEHIQQSTERM